MTRSPSLLDAVNIDHAVEFSYRDYHIKGMDYLCLFRSAGLEFEDARASGAEAWDQYEFHTPLEGGAGFSFVDRTTLLKRDRAYGAGDTYFNRAHSDIHTLADVAPGTVLLLTQFADVGPVSTSTYVAPGEPAPSIAGLYGRMDRTHAERRIDQLHHLLRRGTA